MIEGPPFEDGTTVTVIPSDDIEQLGLTPEQEEELLEAIAEIDRRNYVDGDELLRSLKIRL